MCIFLKYGFRLLCWLFWGGRSGIGPQTGQNGPRHYNNRQFYIFGVRDDPRVPIRGGRAPIFKATPRMWKLRTSKITFDLGFRINCSILFGNPADCWNWWCKYTTTLRQNLCQDAFWESITIMVRQKLHLKWFLNICNVIIYVASVVPGQIIGSVNGGFQTVVRVVIGLCSLVLQRLVPCVLFLYEWWEVVGSRCKQMSEGPWIRNQNPPSQTPPRDPRPCKFFMFEASFPSKYSKKGLHKEFRWGVSWGRRILYGEFLRVCVFFCTWVKHIQSWINPGGPVDAWAWVWPFQTIGVSSTVPTKSITLHPFLLSGINFLLHRTLCYTKISPAELMLLHYTAPSSHFLFRTQKNVRTPTTTTSQKSIAMHLQFVLQYASNLYCSAFGAPTLGGKGNIVSTPPICIAIRLPFASQHFWEILVVVVTRMFPMNMSNNARFCLRKLASCLRTL